MYVLLCFRVIHIYIICYINEIGTGLVMTFDYDTTLLNC